MARKPGDPLSNADEVYVIHDGKSHEVAVHGGHVTSRVWQGALGPFVRWDESGSYLKIEHSAALRAFGSRTRKLEVLDDLDGERSWLVAELPVALAHSETWDDGLVRWTALPLHVLTRYRRVKGRLRKVKDERPCACVACAPYATSGHES